MQTPVKWTHVADVPVEKWESPERGRVAFRTLFGGQDVVPGGLTVGVADVEPGDGLKRHSHPPAEVYYVLQGRCSVVVGDEQRELVPGGSVLIPGDQPHAVMNPGPDLVRILYVLAAASMAEVDYSFDPDR
jgi:quercetin dioxygenase-like cupin family protein